MPVIALWIGLDLLDAKLTLFYGGWCGNMKYYIAGVLYSDELYHHGIIGQKWGIRRYQNPDGTYTEEGRKRYSTSNSAYGFDDNKRLNATERYIKMYGDGYTKGLFRLDKKITKKSDLGKDFSKEVKKADAARVSAEYYRDLGKRYSKLPDLEKTRLDRIVSFSTSYAPFVAGMLTGPIGVTVASTIGYNIADNQIRKALG